MEKNVLNTFVAESPRVFSAPEGMRIYVVGDIHGRSDLLENMLEAISCDAQAHPSQQIVEVFLGDYIDRGFHSRKVIDILMKSPPKGHERVCLLGNHEAILLEFLDNPDVIKGWSNYGGYSTLASYGIPIPMQMTPESLRVLHRSFCQAFPKSHEEFLRSLPLSFELGDYFFVHAGVDPHKKIGEQSIDEYAWIRKEFLNHKGFFEKYIVHGHTPISEPEILPNRANLDVSNSEDNALCCLVINQDEKHTFLVHDDASTNHCNEKMLKQ